MILLVLYAADVLLLFIYGVNTYLLIHLARKNRDKCSSRTPELREYPFVTVQLPVYNEKYVVERLVEAAAGMDYPRDRFEIQVLDDSTDETLEVSLGLCRRLQAQGVQICVLHRDRRQGHKAGALREALSSARGELIAVFDADFIPAPTLLRRTVPHFQEDPRLGMVQTRWGHVNAEYSVLTKAQALMIDGHFAIEQTARGGSNLFFNFNGTAGVWRRECIMDAGNWQDDTLTEDLDLSYRAELRGWKMRYVHDVVSPAELPIHIQAYKSQQFRWAKGSVQTTLKLGSRVLRAREGLFKRLEALLHLTYYFVHPLLLANILLFVPVILCVDTPSLVRLAYSPLMILFVPVMVAPLVFIAYSQASLHRDWPRRLGWLPFSIFLGTGMAAHNSRAIIEALLGRRSEFVRTPKWGIRSRTDSWRDKSYRTGHARASVALLELGFGLYALAGVVLAAARGLYVAAIPCLIFAASFFFVFALDVAHASQAGLVEA